MSSVFGNIIDGLKKLMQALQAIEPAPDSTTVYFNDQVLCKNPSIPDVSTTYASDMIQMENGTEEVILNSTGLSIVNANMPFIFEIDNWFMRYNCGFSLRTDLSINVVSKTDAFKVSEGGMNFDFDSFTDYLTPGGDAGFSVILSNSYNLDIDVTTPDIMFYAHSVGATSSPFTLRKYATARFTLVVVTSYPIGYAWAVSMY